MVAVEAIIVHYVNVSDIFTFAKNNVFFIINIT